jgi:hypothetical protein
MKQTIIKKKELLPESCHAHLGRPIKADASGGVSGWRGKSYLALVASVIDETRTQIVQRVRPGAIVGPARYFFCFFVFSCL